MIPVPVGTIGCARNDDAVEAALEAALATACDVGLRQKEPNPGGVIPRQETLLGGAHSPAVLMERTSDGDTAAVLSEIRSREGTTGSQPCLTRRPNLERPPPAWPPSREQATRMQRNVPPPYIVPAARMARLS